MQRQTSHSHAELLSWQLRALAAGDIATAMGLYSDDVVFD
jgi:ketosteroid isomerase-like protein